MIRNVHRSVSTLVLAPAIALGVFSAGAAAGGTPGPAGPEADEPARTQAQSVYRAQLSGGEMVPPVQTQARGNAVFRVTPNSNGVQFQLSVSNIQDIQSAHLQTAAAGQNGPAIVQLHSQATPGPSSGQLASGTLTAADLTGPWAGEPLSKLIEAMAAGTIYVIVRTESYPAGVIRGQVR
jgi:hypothetical protein